MGSSTRATSTEPQPMYRRFSTVQHCVSLRAASARRRWLASTACARTPLFGAGAGSISTVTCGGATGCSAFRQNIGRVLLFCSAAAGGARCAAGWLQLGGANAGVDACAVAGDRAGTAGCDGSEAGFHQDGALSGVVVE